MGLGAFIGLFHRLQRASFVGGAYLYCHVEALADIADLRLELICVCLVRSFLTPHANKKLCFAWIPCFVCSHVLLVLRLVIFQGWVVVDLQQQRGEWEEMRSGKGCR